jgi:hypothetical protein
MNDMNQTSSKFARLLALGLLAGLAGLTLGLPAPALAEDNEAREKKADEESEDDEQVDGEAGAVETADGETGEMGKEQAQAAVPSLRRGNRMEFDARLIRGESAGSGAVFLFQRAQRPLPSMITKRTSFLRDTVGSLLGDEWAEKFDEAQTQNADTRTADTD